MAAVDFFGRPFTAGDRVVYPLRHSSSMWLEEATVVEVSEETDYRNNIHYTLKVRKPNDKVVKLTALARVVIV